MLWSFGDNVLFGAAARIQERLEKGCLEWYALYGRDGDIQKVPDVFVLVAQIVVTSAYGVSRTKLERSSIRMSKSSAKVSCVCIRCLGKKCAPRGSGTSAEMFQSGVKMNGNQRLKKSQVGNKERCQKEDTNGQAAEGLV